MPRPGPVNCIPATISIPVRRSRWTRTPARSRAITSTTGTTRGTGTRSAPDADQHGPRRPETSTHWSMPRATDTCGCCSRRTTASSSSTASRSSIRTPSRASTRRPAAPSYDADHKPVIGKNVTFCPSLWGGKDWPSAAYSPTRRTCSTSPPTTTCAARWSGEKKQLLVGQLWLGADPDSLKLLPHGDHIGELQAWDPATGKRVWMHPFPKSQLFDSVLSTAGGSGVHRWDQ